MNIKLLIIIFTLTSRVAAEVTLDGTLGKESALMGPNYQISGELGQQQGENLFHSFRHFNLKEGESATFSGPDHLRNIISRVTGGEPSLIDGTLRSTVPNADLYFLNPYGILLSSHAQLDVQGSFYASTADTLYLQDGGEFNAQVPEHSHLTVAPPKAFGFLTNSPSPLTLEQAKLSLKPEKTLSLLGGHLTIKNSQLQVEGGTVNLTSTSQEGSIELETTKPMDDQKSTITFSENSLIDVSGQGEGKIILRGGQLFVNDSFIKANNTGTASGQGIFLTLGHSIHLRGQKRTDLEASTLITSHTSGPGRAGDIILDTPHLEMIGSTINNSTKGEGPAGHIYIQADEVALYEGAAINSDSWSRGQGGQINLTVTGTLLVSEQRFFATPENADISAHISVSAIGQGAGGHLMIQAKHIELVGGNISANSHFQGNAGKLVINADTISLTKGGLITATAFSRSSAIEGGRIEIQTNQLELSGFRAGYVRTATDIFKNLPSGIGVLTTGSAPAGHLHIVAKKIYLNDYGSIGAATLASGPAGDVLLEVDTLYLKGGGRVIASSGGFLGGILFVATGTGGHIKIIAKDIIASGKNEFNPSGILSNTLLTAEGGDIEVHADRVFLDQGAAISVESLGKGNAGKITLEASELYVSDNGSISTSASHATGGNVLIKVPHLLYLREGKITTSVGAGQGRGGDITVQAPSFVVLNQGQIKAQADGGRGGDIRITAQNYIKSIDSLVSASSKIGIDGQIMIQAPQETFSGSLMVLPGKVMDGIHLLRKPCGVMTFEEFENRSRFAVTSLAGSHSSPVDWKPSAPSSPPKMLMHQ